MWSCALRLACNLALALAPASASASYASASDCALPNMLLRHFLTSKELDCRILVVAVSSNLYLGLRGVRP